MDNDADENGDEMKTEAEWQVVPAAGSTEVITISLDYRPDGSHNPRVKWTLVVAWRIPPVWSDENPEPVLLNRGDLSGEWFLRLSDARFLDWTGSVFADMEACVAHVVERKAHPSAVVIPR
jgi:hypothetical protein